MAELYGQEVGDLPEGWIATGLLVLVKAYNPNCDENEIPVRLSIRGTLDLPIIDALGMIHAAKLDISKSYLDTMGDG